MDTPKTIEEVGSLTIHNMDIDLKLIDVIADANKPGREREFALALVQYFYKPIADRLPPHSHYRERALYTAKWKATKILISGDIQGLVERATVYILDDARETGWYVNMEYETLQELLASMVEGIDESGSTYADIHFVADKLIPIAKQLAIPIEKLVSASHQVHKLRSSVPSCRRVVKDLEAGRISASEAAESLDTILSQVADKNVSSQTFQEFVNKWSGKRNNKPEELPGTTYIMPGNRTWMVVELEQGPDAERAIEMATKGLVKWQLGDLGDLAKKILGNTRKTL